MHSKVLLYKCAIHNKGGRIMKRRFKNEFIMSAVDPLHNINTENLSKESNNVINDKKYHKIIDLSFF